MNSSSAILKTSLSSTLRLIKASSRKRPSMEISSVVSETTTKVAVDSQSVEVISIDVYKNERLHFEPTISAQTSITAVNVEKGALLSSNTVNLESRDSEITVPGKQPKPPKIYPNVFLCFRVQNPLIISRIEAIHDNLLKASEKFKSKLTPLSALHITLFVANIKDEEIPSAIKAMKESIETFRTTENKLEAEFHGISSFDSRVLYGAVKGSSLEPLRLLQKTTKDSFIVSGINVINDFPEFTPHLTIARCRNPKKEKELAKILKAQKTPNYDIGIENVKDIVLCRMQFDKNTEDFYKIIHTEAIFDIDDDKKLKEK